LIRRWSLRCDSKSLAGAVLAGGDDSVKHKVTLIRGDAPDEVTAGRLFRTAKHQQYREEKIQ
jgi:hypothetical protein